MNTQLRRPSLPTNAIFVTGAGGNVGQALLPQLLRRKQSVIASKRLNQSRRDQENLHFRPFDFTDPTTWETCLQGVNRVFLIRPPHMSRIKRDMIPFLGFLAKKPIRQLVFLSVQGAEKNAIVPHHRIEMAIGKLGIPATFLRPSFFMQNLSTTHLVEIRDEKRLFVPTGQGRTNFIDVRDIGEIAAMVFNDSHYWNRAYTITGERSYSYQEVAQALSRGLNQEIRFSNPKPLDFLFYHLKKGRPITMSLVMLALYSVVRSGKGDTSNTTSKEILGRRLRSLDDFIHDHRELLAGE